jgi:hypothetical protein
METHDRKLLDQSMENWNDLVEVAIYPVSTLIDAVKQIVPRL